MQRSLELDVYQRIRALGCDVNHHAETMQSLQVGTDHRVDEVHTLELDTNRRIEIIGSIALDTNSRVSELELNFSRFVAETRNRVHVVKGSPKTDGTRLSILSLVCYLP